jgi:hypothetical protein
VASELDDWEAGNTTVCARAYSVVLRQAHARTFYLQEKINEAKRDELLLDPDVEEIVSRPKQPELFSSPYISS